MTSNATLQRLLRVELLIAVALLALLAVAAFWLLRRALRPLERISEVAGGNAQGDLDVRLSPAEGRREIGRLYLALNGMLERLEDAFARQDRSEAQLRRFASSASHELRTPLTWIRVYAALLRRGARHNPEDLEKSIFRIESEATRMAGLIDDLLLLARFDEQRPLGRTRTDLAVIAREAADDARARDPGRSITVDACGPVVVIGDEPRLRQIVANLLENARVHTPAKAPVRVEVGVRDGMGVLAVIDTGPGIEPVPGRTSLSASIAARHPRAATRPPARREAASGWPSSTRSRRPTAAPQQSPRGPGSRFEITVPPG